MTLTPKDRPASTLAAQTSRPWEKKNAIYTESSVKLGKTRQAEEVEPDPLQGSVGISALWATIEDATLSPRAHIALLDGPGTQMQLEKKHQHEKEVFQILFYPRMKSLLCSTTRVVWGFLRHDPSRPTLPVDTDANFWLYTKKGFITDDICGRCESGIYLHWYSFGNVHDQLHIGIVVIVWPTRNRYIVVSHFDVF